MKLTLFRIQAPHFVAGFVGTDRVVFAAPILKWAVGKFCDEVLAYAQQKGWQTQVLS